MPKIPENAQVKNKCHIISFHEDAFDICLQQNKSPTGTQAAIDEKRIDIDIPPKKNTKDCLKFRIICLMPFLVLFTFCASC